MMTGMVLPVGRATAMIMSLIIKSVAARKDIPRHPVRKVRKVLTSARMTALISKNVFLPVPNYVTCELPYYGVGEACDGKYASCEKDTERACQELNPGYVDECGTGQQLSDDRCSYDNTYGTCCNTCAGYDNTTIPEGYVQDGESCTGCDGQEHYKIKPNPCDGFMDCGSMGGEAGAKTCLSGTTTMYDNCKACPNLGEYTTCPSCTICQYEECSGLWYATGCATNCTDYCDFCGG